MKKITLELINSFTPCYDPREIGIDETSEFTPLDFIENAKVKNPKDFLWLFLRSEFMTDKDLRLFAVWCARQALEAVKNPDLRSIEACNVAERFANGEASEQESAAWAAWGAWATAEAAQIEHLKTYLW